MVQIDVPGKPRVLGSTFALQHRKTGPKLFSQTAFRYPDMVEFGPDAPLLFANHRLDLSVRGEGGLP